MIEGTNDCIVTQDENVPVSEEHNDKEEFEGIHFSFYNFSSLLCRQHLVWF